MSLSHTIFRNSSLGYNEKDIKEDPDISVLIDMFKVSIPDKFDGKDIEEKFINFFSPKINGKSEFSIFKDLFFNMKNNYGDINTLRFLDDSFKEASIFGLQYIFSYLDNLIKNDDFIESYRNNEVKCTNDKTIAYNLEAFKRYFEEIKTNHLNGENSTWEDITYSNYKSIFNQLSEIFKVKSPLDEIWFKLDELRIKEEEILKEISINELKKKINTILELKISDEEKQNKLRGLLIETKRQEEKNLVINIVNQIINESNKKEERLAQKYNEFIDKFSSQNNSVKKYINDVSNNFRLLQKGINDANKIFDKENKSNIIKLPIESKNEFNIYKTKMVSWKEFNGRTLFGALCNDFFKFKIKVTEFNEIFKNFKKLYEEKNLEELTYSWNKADNIYNYFQNEKNLENSLLNRINNDSLLLKLYVEKLKYSKIENEKRWNSIYQEIGNQGNSILNQMRQKVNALNYKPDFENLNLHSRILENQLSLADDLKKARRVLSKQKKYEELDKTINDLANIIVYQSQGIEILKKHITSNYKLRKEQDKLSRQIEEFLKL